MSDIGELYDGLREHSQQKRARNREDSARVLTSKGVPFTQHNAGAHLVVTVGEQVVDFWPGTGKWITRGKARFEGRGVFRLLAYIGK